MMNILFHPAVVMLGITAMVVWHSPLWVFGYVVYFIGLIFWSRHGLGL